MNCKKCVSLDSKENIFYFLMLFIFVAIFYYKMFFVLKFLWGVFPKSYIWSELLLNYEGGFLRRALLGEILYYLADFVNVATIGLLLLFVVYTLFSFLFIKTILKQYNIYCALFIIFSPMLLFFPVNLIDVGSMAYGRKDIFILLALYFLIQLSVHSYLSENSNLTALSVRFYSIFAVVFLIHESIIMFLPLAGYFLLLNYEKQKKFWIGLFIFIFACLIGVVISLLFNASSIELIDASWAQHGIDYAAVKGPRNYLPLSPLEMMKLTLVRFNAPAKFIALVLFIPMFIPLLIQLHVYGWHKIWKYISTSRIFILFFVGALLAPFSLFLVAMDYGRWIYMIGCSYYLFFGGIFMILKEKKVIPQFSPYKISFFSYLLLGASVFYCLSWRMRLGNHIGGKGTFFDIITSLPSCFGTVFAFSH